MESLAVKYRPKTWNEVCEQNATLIILQQQLASNEVKNCYLFCGPAGCGKTTLARIFANEINEHKGVPIELDAASNNSVDDVREIIKQAKTTSLDSEYKIFIMDEVHALSNSAWQAMLKMLEEPPVKSIFIMCTTEKNKIPKTILSRVQQFDFQRISQKGIEDRLAHIVSEENVGGDTLDECNKSEEAIQYIAKIADGGMRDAITLLDKCLAYSNDLTLENVLKALGIADYALMMELISAYTNKECMRGLNVINDVYMQGLDLKQFMKSVTDFTIDIYKYCLGADFKYLACPDIPDIHKFLDGLNITVDSPLLDSLVKLNQAIKWDTNPKARIEAWIIIGE